MGCGGVNLADALLDQDARDTLKLEQPASWARPSRPFSLHQGRVYRCLVLILAVVGCGEFNLADALLDLDARDNRELRSTLELAPALAGPPLVRRWPRLTEPDRWSLATDGYLCKLTCTACGKTYVARPTSEVCSTCAA